jgi:hypothetical protein
MPIPWAFAAPDPASVPTVSTAAVVKAATVRVRAKLDM